MLCLRIRAGAAVGKIVLPTVASTAPVLIRRKIVGKNHQLFFQVWGRHSWRESANEGLRIRAQFIFSYCCAGTSPALSAHFSTGDRRQHHGKRGVRS